MRLAKGIFVMLSLLPVFGLDHARPADKKESSEDEASKSGPQHTPQDSEARIDRKQSREKRRDHEIDQRLKMRSTEPRPRQASPVR